MRELQRLGELVGRSLPCAALALSLGACADTTRSSGGEGALLAQLRSGIQVSTPLQSRYGALASGAGSDSLLVFVSMPPGSLASGDSIALSRSGDARSITIVNVSNGGFDPVALFAGADDSLDIVLYAHGYSATMGVRVPANRHPSVIRTTPARGRTDVPLNQEIVIVFSQPLEASSVTTTTIQLTQGSVTVPATVSIEIGQPWIVHLAPSAPLAPLTTYAIDVSTSVANVNGDALLEAVRSQFTTIGVSDQSSVNAPPCSDPSSQRVLEPGVYDLTSVNGGPPPYVIPNDGHEHFNVLGATLAIGASSSFELDMNVTGQWVGYTVTPYTETGAYQLCGNVLHFYELFPDISETVPRLMGHTALVEPDLIRMTMPNGDLGSDNNDSMAFVLTRRP